MRHPGSKIHLALAHQFPVAEQHSLAFDLGFHAVSWDGIEGLRIDQGQAAFYSAINNRLAQGVFAILFRDRCQSQDGAGSFVTGAFEQWDDIGH